jgi:hypothetical protein
MKIQLGDFNAKAGKENNVKPTNCNYGYRRSVGSHNYKLIS